MARIRAYVAWNRAGHGTDHVRLEAALARSPCFYRGGWILDLQRGAAAITLDRCIFFRREYDDLDLTTVVHELVHVAQYEEVGSVAFLTGYFGEAAETLIDRIRTRQPLGVMCANPHETEAYALAGRFATWNSTTAW